MHSFRVVWSAAQPRSRDSHIVPTSLTYFWSYAMIHLRQKKKLLTINEQKNLHGRCTHDSRADDPRHSGQYPQKCNAHKQAEGDHFESFLQYLKKLFWILFQVLASFFFYESYFLSYALILGVSREKSYCIVYANVSVSLTRVVLVPLADSYCICFDLLLGMGISENKKIHDHVRSQVIIFCGDTAEK